MFLNYLFLGLISALRPSADTLYHLLTKVPKFAPYSLIFRPPHSRQLYQVCNLLLSRLGSLPKLSFWNHF